MVKVSDLKSIDGDVTQQIIDFLIKKYLEINYSKESIVISYLCENGGFDNLDDYNIENWWDEELSMDDYIKYHIPKELKPIFVKKMYEALNLDIHDMEKEGYEDSLMNQRGAFLMDLAYNHMDPGIYSKSLDYFEKIGFDKHKSRIELSLWPLLKKEFEQSLIESEKIPEEINLNRDIIDNSRTEENLKSLYKNVPNERKNYANDNDELNRLFPIKDETLTDDEIIDKYYEEALDNIKQKIYNDEIVERYDVEWIKKIYKNISEYSRKALYHESYHSIESLCKYDSNYNYNEIRELANKFDSLDMENIYDEGFKLLKEDAIKYILIIRQMMNTKNAALLRGMINIIFNDDDFNNYKEDVSKVLSKIKYAHDLIYAVNYGHDVNEINYERNIPFAFFSSKDEFDILKDYNYNFDLLDENGDNIMMYNVKNYVNEEVLPYLLPQNLSEYLKQIPTLNFNLFHKNRNGETLLDLFLKTKFSKNQELIELFKKLYSIKIRDIDVEFNNKLKEVEEKIKVYKK